MTKKKMKRRGKKEVGTLSPAVLDELLANYSSPEDLTGPDGLLKQLTAALVNRVMEAELTEHVGYERQEPPSEEQSNRRNGKTSKRVRSGHGELRVEVPRDREGTFEPQLIAKHQRHFDGFDEKILSMYARGMSVRDIQAQLEELYGVEVSPQLISRATEAVVGELKSWQQRPLEAVYPIVYLDALVVKMRDKGVVQNKSVYLAVGVGIDGERDVLGMWIQSTEGAKFWLSVLTELRQRGVEDIFVLCADGLTGLPQAVEASYPQAIFQTCIVHMVRSSMRFVSWKERKRLCADLRKIYTAADEQSAMNELDAFEKKWGERFPTVAGAWRRRWDEISPFLAFPFEIRRAIYTTNTIEALNRMLRKVLKTKGALPSDEAASKLLFLAIRNAKKTWGRKQRLWPQALQQFSICFPERFPIC